MSKTLAELEVRYRKRMFLKDDLGKRYCLFYNQETEQEILRLIGLFKTHKLSVTGTQEERYPITVGGRKFTVLQSPSIFTLDLKKFYAFALSRGRDFHLVSKEEYEQMGMSKRKKLIKKRKRYGN